MAVIKSGNSTDQATVDPISKAIRVSLYDANGNANAVPLATSTTGALESSGNLSALRLQDNQTTTEILRLILIEQRITNSLLAQGLNLDDEQIERWREDRSFTQIDTANS